MKRIAILVIILCSFILISCNTKPNKINNAEEFEKLFEGAIKYDVRSDTDCENGHIKGFVCMGENSDEELVKNISLVSYNKDQIIILIGDEERVLTVFKALGKKGFKNLYYFDGGFEAYASQKGESYEPETGCGC